MSVPERPLQPPDDGLECNPDGTFCHEKCEDWKKEECMREAHEDGKCWLDCPECERERIKAEAIMEERRENASEDM